MNLVYASYDGKTWVDQGILPSFVMDLAYGEDENDFEITVPTDTYVPTSALVYIEGTEYGGVVRGRKVSTFDEPTSVITGQTWHGILAETYLLPPNGETHYTVDGELNKVLAEIISHAGLDYLFQASAANSSIEVSFTFDRFTDAYSGLRKMFAQYGLKLKVEKLPRAKAVLSATPAGSYIDERDGSGIDYEITDDTAYNHILCIGKGEGEDRVVVNLYADRFGNISKTPSYFGVERRTYLYELTQADEAKITEDGIKKLQELRKKAGTCDLRLPDGRSYDVDDTVGVVDEINGVTVTAAVSKVIVNVSSSGEVVVSNEVGSITARKQ